MLPSLSWLVGLRTRDGAEFGVGPNVTPAGTALAIAAGVTVRAGVLEHPHEHRDRAFESRHARQRPDGIQHAPPGDEGATGEIRPRPCVRVGPNGTPDERLWRSAASLLRRVTNWRFSDLSIIDSLAIVDWGWLIYWGFGEIRGTTDRAWWSHRAGRRIRALARDSDRLNPQSRIANQQRINNQPS